MGIKTRDTININNAATNPDYIGRTALAPENGTLASPTIPNELNVTNRFTDVGSVTFDISTFLPEYQIPLITGNNIISYTVPYEFNLVAMLLTFFYPEFFTTESDIAVFFPNGFGTSGDSFNDGRDPSISAGVWADYSIVNRPNKADVGTIGTYSGHSNDLVNGKNAHFLLNEKFRIIKNALGQQYIPWAEFNGIGNLIPGEGYTLLTRVAAEGRFKTLGIADQNIFNLTQYLEFQNQLVYNIPSGWSIIGFNRTEAREMDEIFKDCRVNGVVTDITNKIIIMKNNAAAVYWPLYDFNGIGLAEPGVAYQIRMSEAIENFTFAPDAIPDFIDLPFVDKVNEPNLF